MTLPNKLSVLAFAGFSAAAGATGTPSGYPSTPVSVTNNIQMNSSTNVSGNVNNSVTIGGQSGSSATDNSVTNNIVFPLPKIVEIPAFMGSCRGSKWQSFFQDAVVNAVYGRPSYSLKEVSARSVSIQLDRQRSESEMSDIAALVQDKITPKPVIKTTTSDIFSNNTNVNVNASTSTGASGGSVTVGNITAIVDVPTETKVVKYFCSDFNIK